MLPPEKVADPERKQRFVQEAKAASALNHPNIVTVHDISQIDGATFIAMEYVEGKTLDQFIPHKGLKLHDTLSYAIQIAGALAKAHAAGIVHRDLKPSNVMVTGDGLVKVLDFGLAKLTEPLSGEQAPTQTLPARTEEGRIVGTLAYMSPEQAEAKPIDARSDIFTFGSLLYEMVTGQRAFQGSSPADMLAAVLRSEPERPSHTAPDLPRDLEKIILRCLQKDPAKRFQHLSDAKVELEELKGASESGTLETRSALQKDPAGRRRRLRAAAVPVITLLAGLFSGALLWHRSSRPDAAVGPVLPKTVHHTCGSCDGRSSSRNLTRWAIHRLSCGERLSRQSLLVTLRT